MRYYDNNGQVFYTGELEDNKKEAIDIISKNYYSIAKENSFICSLGFEVDNRWVEKNDLDNVNCCLSVWFKKFPILIFRDANNVTHNITKEQLEIIKEEMELNRLLLLSAKWFREKDILNAKSVEEIWLTVDKTDEEMLKGNAII